MTGFEYVAIFAAGFASVFLHGFQSRAVNHGNYVLAGCGSFLIAMAQAPLWVMIVKHSGSPFAVFVYGLSGSCAILSAMFIHQRFFTKRAANSGK